MFCCAVATATHAFNKHLRLLRHLKKLILFFILIYKFGICILYSCRGADDTQKEAAADLPLDSLGAAALNVFPPCCPIFQRTSAECTTLLAIHASYTLMLVIILALNGAYMVLTFLMVFHFLAMI